MNDENNLIAENNLFRYITFAWRNKRPVLIRLLIISIFTVVLVLFMPNTYKSHATLSFKSDDGIGSSSIASALGSFANIAGINAPSQANATTKDIALESILSFTFFMELYKQNDFLVNLMAVEGFDVYGNSVIDQDIYDKEAKKWVKGISHPQDAFDKYLKKVTVNEDDFKPIITVNVLSLSPYAARDMNSSILTNIDKFIKTKDVNESKRAIDYLEAEISKTQIQDIRDALSKMITQYMSKLVTSEKSDTYLFDIIEKPYAPIDKYSPKRAIICIQVFIIFLFLELLHLFIGFVYKKEIKFSFKEGFSIKSL